MNLKQDHDLYPTTKIILKEGQPELPNTDRPV